jgi:hypothetical protein
VSEDRKRRRALGELTVEDQPGQAAEVITVEVGEGDMADARGIDARALQRDQSGGAAVEQERRAALACQVEAGRHAPAGAERVARSDEGETDAHSAFSNQWWANGSSLNGATSA